jgi:hypothetical protein
MRRRLQVTNAERNECALELVRAITMAAMLENPSVDALREAAVEINDANDRLLERPTNMERLRDEATREFASRFDALHSEAIMMNRDWTLSRARQVVSEVRATPAESSTKFCNARTHGRHYGSTCSKRATYVVTMGDGTKNFRCGIHAPLRAEAREQEKRRVERQMRDERWAREEAYRKRKDARESVYELAKKLVADLRMEPTASAEAEALMVKLEGLFATAEGR